MIVHIDWPPLPDIKKDDLQAEFKKIRYQAELDIVIAGNAARIALDKAKVEAQIAQDKAKADAQIALDKAKYDAQLELEKLQQQADIEREKMDWANEFAQAQAVHAAYLDIAKTSLERSIARATFVQTAAGAISTIYLGILALRIGSGGAVAARGLGPSLFLGTAIAFAAAYLAFLTRPGVILVKPSDGTLPGLQRQRRNVFIHWVTQSVQRRRLLLQMAVVSLGVGAVLLPLPFVDVEPVTVVILLVLGVVAVLVVPFVIEAVSKIPDSELQGG